MAKYKITVEELSRTYENNPYENNPGEGDSGRILTDTWTKEAEIMGDEVIVAGALRGLADKLDPPKISARDY